MKLTLNDVTNINGLSVINDNFDRIEQEFQNKVLYRDNPVGEPNELQNDVDMNGNVVFNQDAPVVTGSRASGDALVSLLAALDAQGIIVDNTAA